MVTTFRVGLIGSKGIGKTSIVLRFIGNYFSRSFKPSNGVFRIDHQLMVDGEQINLIVNDFPGNTDSSSPMFNILKSMDAILIVTNSDYTDSGLKKMLKDRVEELRGLFAFTNPYIAFVSNVFEEESERDNIDNSESASTFRSSPPPMLSDLANMQRSREMKETVPTSGDKLTEELASLMQIDFYRVSASTGMGIQSMFEMVCKNLIQLLPDRLLEGASTTPSSVKCESGKPSQEKLHGLAGKKSLKSKPEQKRRTWSCFCIPRKPVLPYE